MERIKCQCGKTKDRGGYCDGSHNRPKHIFDMNNLPFPYL